MAFQSLARLGGSSAFRMAGFKPFQMCKFAPCTTRFRSTTVAVAEAQPRVTAADSKYYVLRYTYVPDILEKRGPHREEHLAAAREWGKSGKLILAGALTEPVDGALFVFKDATIEEIEEFAAKDPYVINALVADSVVRPMATVVAP